MSVLVLSFFSVAVSAGAPNDAAEPLTLSVDFVTKASSTDLAKAVLPPQVAVRVAGHKLHPPVLHELEGYTVRFWERTTGFGTGFCQRYLWVVSMPRSTKGRLEPGNPTPGAELKIADDCTTVAEPFIHLNQTPNFLAVEYLNWFKKLHSAAGGPGDLNADVECRSDLTPDPCTAGARQVLADLPLHRISSIERAGGQRRSEEDWRVSVMPDDAPGRYWQVSVFGWQANRPRVRVSWAVIPPF